MLSIVVVVVIFVVVVVVVVIVVIVVFKSDLFGCITPPNAISDNGVSSQ